MKRYPPEHVLEALDAADRGVFTPYSQIVLAAEVRAQQSELRELNRQAVTGWLEIAKQAGIIVDYDFDPDSQTLRVLPVGYAERIELDVGFDGD